MQPEDLPVDPGAVVPGLISPGTLAWAGGWLAVIVIVVMAMIRGWLVPRTQQAELIRSYERLVESYTVAIADRDRQIVDWRETARTEAARADILARNQEKMLEGLGTTNDLIRALGKAVEGSR